MTPAARASRPISRLLVANRGELVGRIARTCRRMGVTTVALVTPDQRGQWWSTAADERFDLATGYLDIDGVLGAARAARADSVHPGYGFLAESAEFAEAVMAAGLRWVGPPPSAMRALGDKAAGRRLAMELEIPVLPGYEGNDQSDATLAVEAARIGFPVLLKPSAGGGGKGMHEVSSPETLLEALRRARREAEGAFGDDRLVIERLVERPRHVEIQILVDGQGHGVHLGERDCSLQRRHQKVVEESPSPAVGEQLRARLGEAAVRLATAAGYRGAGTVEFLLDDSGAFYFLELNARLQVEHPVTELVTGRDLVEDQLRIAAGEELGFAQADVLAQGHAVEARLYAEDPWDGFLPAVGAVRAVRWPSDVRVDAGIAEGDVIGTRYDPLLAKLISHGSTRQEALDRLIAAVEETRVFGVTTNRGFLRWVLSSPTMRAGDARTDLIDAEWHPLSERLPEAGWAAAARVIAGSPSVSPRVGWRLNAPAVVRLAIGGEKRNVLVPASEDADSQVEAFVPGRRDGDDSRATPEVLLDLDGRSFTARLAAPPDVDAAVSHAHRAAGGAQSVTASMPGTVVAVRVAEGEDVAAHAVLVVLEAMKMENAVTAPADGRVERVLVSAGQTVQRGEPLMELS